MAGTGFAALDAELPDPLRSQTLALFAALDVSGRRAISALLPWLPDGRASAFFTTLAGSGNDIALLLLDGPPAGEERETITPARLPKRPARVGTSVRLTGWGVTVVTEFGSAGRDVEGKLQSSSRYLRVGTIRVQRPADCNSNENFRNRRYRLVAGQICAGSPDGVDACKGDSGGPLVRLAATRSGFQPVRPFEAVALVSYGPGCGLARTPGVYTDVHHFADWVAGARAQFQPGRIIDWVPGRCLHDNAEITLGNGTGHAGHRSALIGAQALHKWAQTRTIHSCLTVLT